MLSVVVPTWNAGVRMAELSMSLNSQTIPCEIVVVDSSSSDCTAKAAEQQGAKVIRINRDSFDHGGTRNLGVRAASGDIIVFLTQDALPVNEYMLENLTVPLRDPAVPLSYGRQRARRDASPLEQFAREFNYPERPAIKGAEDIQALGIKTFFCSNVCSAVRRREFEEVGGFPEGIIMNEDMVLAATMIRRGYKVAYEPSAAVYHSHNYSFKDQFRRYFDIGTALNRSGLAFETGKTEGEGLRYMKEQVVYLAGKRKLHWLPLAIAEALAKYAGFRMGLSEERIPEALKAFLSLHAGLRELHE